MMCADKIIIIIKMAGRSGNEIVKYGFQIFKAFGAKVMSFLSDGKKGNRKIIPWRWRYATRYVQGLDRL